PGAAPSPLSDAPPQPEVVEALAPVAVPDAGVAPDMPGTDAEIISREGSDGPDPVVRAPSPLPPPRSEEIAPPEDTAMPSGAIESEARDRQVVLLEERERPAIDGRPGSGARVPDSVADPAKASDSSAPRSAITANAEPFSNPQDLPLLAIILIDDGLAAGDSADVPTLDVRITMAVDPATAGAEAATQAYRAAGREVLVLARSLPVNGTEQDAETALVAISRAVGVLDAPDPAIVTDGAARAALLAAMRKAGLGLVVWPGGSKERTAAARQAGVPARAFARILADGDGVDIARSLDRAALTATQEGSAIVVANASPGMIQAISSWADGATARSVVLAPVSHILRGAGGP
ncbi:MAG: divergent polysaccharide deacetylase family protein, partial [Jannaschia sp.]